VNNICQFNQECSRISIRTSNKTCYHSSIVATTIFLVFCSCFVSLNYIMDGADYSPKTMI